MKLTPKQEAFCLAYLETGCASKAYRQVYDAARMQPKTVQNKASLLLQNEKVKGYLAALRQPVRESAQLSLAGHLQELKALRDRAKEEGKYAPAIQAEVARARAAGLYVDRAKVEGALRICWEDE